MAGAPAVAAEPARASRPSRPQPLALVAALGAAAGLVAVAARIATSFEHGIWLIAYLLLVGALAPALLARGERRLLAAPLEGAGARLLAGLWLAGVIAVPAGVLGSARLLVCAGAACLLAALAILAARAFGGQAVPAAARGRVDATIHVALLIAIAASTAIGVALAWGEPWL